MSHSSTIGGESSPKLAQILCGSPDLGDPGTDAARAARATPPYPLDTFQVAHAPTSARLTLRIELP